MARTVRVVTFSQDATSERPFVLQYDLPSGRQLEFRYPTEDERTRGYSARSPSHKTAVLIASKDGGATITQTVRSVVEQAPVFAVSDGSADFTVAVAEEAGAEVLELEHNVGKPAALHRALHHFGLLDIFAYIAILDDDTTVAPDFLERSLARFEPDVGIVVGHTSSAWPADKRWNVLLGARTYAYWKFQLTIKRGQSALGAVNCVAGSNSVYRAGLLRRVVREDTPYIVDDCYWTHETQRHRLGRIIYAPEARAWVQDPTTFREWWKQNTRWLWGTFQAIYGHKVLRRATWFDFCYLLLIADWFIYIAGGPLLLAALLLGSADRVTFLGIYFLGYFGWAIAAAIATRKPQLVLMAPALVVIDWFYRVVFVYAIYKTVRKPTVAVCKWDSPTRYEEEVLVRAQAEAVVHAQAEAVVREQELIREQEVIRTEDEVVSR